MQRIADCCHSIELTRCIFHHLIVMLNGTYEPRQVNLPQAHFALMIPLFVLNNRLAFGLFKQSDIQILAGLVLTTAVSCQDSRQQTGVFLRFWCLPALIRTSCTGAATVKVKITTTKNISKTLLSDFYQSKTFPHALLLSYSQNSLCLLYIMIVLAVVAALKSHDLCST